MTKVPPMDPNMPLNQLRDRRLSKNRDLKVIITSRNSTTGTGKTTLAAWLALNWDNEWNADEKAALTVQKYLKAYPNLSAGSVLLMDEAEQIDSRRAMSSKNVDFAEKWMMMRVRNVTSILTLPTSSALDKRLKELADIRINVIRRGLARVYRINVDDHNTNQVTEWRWHDIEWPDISEHPEMQALDEMKDKKINGQLEAGDESEGDDSEEELPKELQAELAKLTKEAKGCSWNDVKRHNDRLTYSGSYLRRVWKDVTAENENPQKAASLD